MGVALVCFFAFAVVESHKLLAEHGPTHEVNTPIWIVVGAYAVICLMLDIWLKVNATRLGYYTVGFFTDIGYVLCLLALYPLSAEGDWQWLVASVIALFGTFALFALMMIAREGLSRAKRESSAA